jgi:hypothetical protein
MGLPACLGSDVRDARRADGHLIDARYFCSRAGSSIFPNVPS